MQLRQIDNIIYDIIYKKSFLDIKLQIIVDIIENKYYNMSHGGLLAVKNKRLKIARIERDMKQEDLAKAVGVTRQTIGLIEAGKYNPSLKICLSICKALGKKLDDIFWED